MKKLRLALFTLILLAATISCSSSFVNLIKPPESPYPMDSSACECKRLAYMAHYYGGPYDLKPVRLR